MLVTLIAGVTAAVLQSTMESNAVILAELELISSPFHWMDIADIVTPAASGASAGLAVFLLATVSPRRPFHTTAMTAFALIVLLVPETLEQLLYVFIGFAPGWAWCLPNIFNVAGALSTLLTCAGCLYLLRNSGMVVDYGLASGSRQMSRNAGPIAK